MKKVNSFSPILLIIFTLLLCSTTLIAEDFSAELWLSEQPYRADLMGGFVPFKYRILLPNNPTFGGGENDVSWPQGNPAYAHNGGDTQSDWSINLDNSTGTPYNHIPVYLTQQLTGTIKSMCGFEIVITPHMTNAIPNALLCTDINNENWVGSLFANTQDTGFNENDYTLEYQCSADSIAIKVTPKTLSTSANITVLANVQSYMCKLFFDVAGPGAVDLDFTTYKVYHCPSAGQMIEADVIGHPGYYRHILGDVTAGFDNRRTGDGLVTFADLALWSRSYYAGTLEAHVPMANFYAEKFDFGPTLDGSVENNPTPDGKIDNDDQAIFIKNYMETAMGNYHYTEELPTTKGDPNFSIELDNPFIMAGNSVIATISLNNISEATDLHGFFFALTFDSSLVSIENIETVSLFTGEAPTGNTFETVELNHIGATIASATQCILGPWKQITDGIVAQITIKTKAEGDCVLDFSGQCLSNTEGNAVAAAGNGTTLTIFPSSIDDQTNPPKSSIHAYPNPFKQNTQIVFSAPTMIKETPMVTIYSLRGQKIKTLPMSANANNDSFSAEWDGCNNSGSKQGTGVYFYQVRTSQYQSIAEKILLVR